MPATDVLAALGGPRVAAPAQAVVITVAETTADRAAYARLRHAAFVVDQGLFDRDDRDPVDDDPRTVVLLARQVADGAVVGGVRLAPCTEPDLGWWAGSRLVVTRAAPRGAGAALVRAACAHAAAAGAVRFDALVQADKERFFAALGWTPAERVHRHGLAHVVMRFPIDRFAAAAASKAPLGPLLAGLTRPGDGYLGDDGAPVPGSDLIAACDAIVPAMVERDPWWAGWCGVLVNVNDLTAMGASPIGLLDALAAPTASHAGRIVAGLRAAAAAWDVPVLGGHTQLGAPAALSVTALGRTDVPVPGGGGRVGDPVHVTADLAGGWRPGYHGRQWDSTTARPPDELRATTRLFDRVRPAAAKDVSMAGLVGTLGMLAEASGCGAELDVASIPRPDGASVGDWLTCFPGAAFVTAGPHAPEPGDAPLTVARCGRLTERAGVALTWPDGVRTTALTAGVTHLGPAGAVDRSAHP